MFFALGSASTAAVFRLEHAAAAEAIDATLPAPLGGYLPSNLSSPLLQEPSPAAEGGASFTAIGGAAASCFYALEGVSMVLPVGNALAPEPHPRYPLLLVGALSAVVATFATVSAATASAFPDISSASITADMARRFEGTAHAPLFALANNVVTVGASPPTAMPCPPPPPRAGPTSAHINLCSPPAACLARCQAAVVCTFPLQLTPARLVLDSLLGLTPLPALALHPCPPSPWPWP